MWHSRTSISLCACVFMQDCIKLDSTEVKAEQKSTDVQWFQRYLGMIDFMQPFEWSAKYWFLVTNYFSKYQFLAEAKLLRVSKVFTLFWTYLPWKEPWLRSSQITLTVQYWRFPLIQNSGDSPTQLSAPSTQSHGLHKDYIRTITTSMKITKAACIPLLRVLPPIWTTCVGPNLPSYAKVLHGWLAENHLP